MSGEERPAPPRPPALGAKPVIYKSSLLARTAPGLASAAASDSACVAAAAATAEAVRAQFKAQQERGDVPAAADGTGDAADAARHKRRVTLNRHSAASSRLRREAYVGALEQQLANLEKSYNALFDLVKLDAATAPARSDHDAFVAAEPLAQVAARVAAQGVAAAASAVPGPPALGAAGAAAAMLDAFVASAPAVMPAPAKPEPAAPEAVPEAEPENVPTIPVDVTAAPPEQPLAPPEPAPPPEPGAPEAEPPAADAPAPAGVGAPAPPVMLAGVDELRIPPIPFVDGLAQMDPGLVSDMVRLSGVDGLGGDQPELDLPAGVEPLSEIMLAYNALDLPPGDFDQL